MRLTGVIRNNRGNHKATVVARPKPGVGPEQAQAGTLTVARRIGRGFSSKPEDFGADGVAGRPHADAWLQLYQVLVPLGQLCKSPGRFAPGARIA